MNFADFQIYSKNVVTYVVTRLDKMRFGCYICRTKVADCE